MNGVDERNVSNDTSVGVGFWPLSPLEQMTLAAEDYMNSAEFKKRHPELGEDIKVMCVRRAKAIEIVIACALVDKFVADVDDCIAKKTAILGDIISFLNAAYGKEYRISVTLNALDAPARGVDGLYLTVTGLSCEGGNSGQVGRRRLGQRVNLIPAPADDGSVGGQELQKPRRQDLQLCGARPGTQGDRRKTRGR